MSEPLAVELGPADATDAPEAGLGRDAWLALRHSPTALVAGTIILIMLVIAAFPGPIAGIFGHGDPRLCLLEDSGMPPRAGHPFGFDMQGCDLYANVIYGARPSIVIGLVTTIASLSIAVVLGLSAGFYGRWVDSTISRLMDVFFGFPFILGGIIVLTAFPDRNIWTVALVLTLFSWPVGTRLMRSSVLGVRDADYIVAARALGARNSRLMFRHVLPNAIAPLIVLSTLTVGGVIAAEASLTFLGVGLRLPAISWGLQLSASQGYIQGHVHLLLFPAIFLSVTVLGFILLGDALRDALDPKLR
jgi:oligopeptide transport system permease protein